MPIPQFHSMAVGPFDRHGEGRRIVFRLELAEMINVAAKTVHVIEAIIEHLSPPPDCGESHITTYPQPRRIAGDPPSADKSGPLDDPSEPDRHVQPLTVLGRVPPVEDR